MSGSTAAPTPSLSLAEMQVLVSRAGLVLNPGQMADLVLAWRQVVGLLSLIRRDRPLVDDQAFVFRLPSPVATALPAAPADAPSARPASPRPASPRAGKKAAPRPASPRAGKKAAPRAGKKPAARKPVRRRK